LQFHCIDAIDFFLQLLQRSKNKGIILDNYQTYDWLPPENDVAEVTNTDDFIQMNTRNCFANCMGQRRLKLDTLNPDLLLKVGWQRHKWQQGSKRNLYFQTRCTKCVGWRQKSRIRKTCRFWLTGIRDKVGSVLAV